MSATQARPGQLTPEMLQALQVLGLADEVLASRELLEREDDWDDEGSPGYHEVTWSRAVEFLLRLAARLRSDYQIRLDSAEVLPGSSGRIGLELRTARRRLLIDVPIEPDLLARYYGHDVDEVVTTKGNLDMTLPNAWLVAWLAE